MSRRQFRLRGELRLKNAKLVEFREQLGLTQQAFATRLGIEWHQYNGYETMRVFPSRRRAEFLAEQIGCTLDELFPPELRQLAKEVGLRVVTSEASIEPSRLLSLSRREVLALPASSGPEEEIEQHEFFEVVERSLTTLKPREAKVLRLYYGLETGESMTLGEIGSMLGISPERTRQIVQKALHHLRIPDSREHRALCELAVG